MGEPVEVLGESRVWPGIAIAGACGVALGVVGVWFRLASWYAMLMVVVVLIAVSRRGDALLADEHGLLVRRRGRVRRSYAWTEIERMGWVDTVWWGSMLQVYPRGGPFDVPGPNSPAEVGRIWRPGRRRGGDPLAARIERHGIKSLTDP